MDAATRRTLRRLARTRTPAELKALFAAIRDHDDAALFAAASPGLRKRAKGFAETVAARLASIVAPAGEKAEMLIEVLAETVGAVSVRPSGLVPTVRNLAARYGEDTVGQAVETLMSRMAHWGSTRERVT